MVALFPNLNLDLTGNYDGNRFLVNNTWMSVGLSTAFNLVKAFSLPAADRSAEAQRRLDEGRRLAVAMAVITQTRIAAVRYGLLAHEFGIWDLATQDDEQIVAYLASSAQVGIDTEFELIRAKARQFVSKINRDLTYANLEAALGRIYNSVGLDALPSQVDSHETAALANQLQTRLVRWEEENFAPRAAPIALPVMIGEVQGVPAAMAKEFRASLAKVLELSKIKAVDAADAKLKINAGVILDPPRDGGQPARIKVALVDADTGTVRFSSEFKTTLSDPVDEQQWRTLGEGAAYRVVSQVIRLQAGRGLAQKKLSTPWGDPALKLARSAGASGGVKNPGPAELQQVAAPLGLRSAQFLAPRAAERVSRFDMDGGRRAQ